MIIGITGSYQIYNTLIFNYLTKINIKNNVKKFLTVGDKSSFQGFY